MRSGWNLDFFDHSSCKSEDLEIFFKKSGKSGVGLFAGSIGLGESEDGISSSRQIFFAFGMVILVSANLEMVFPVSTDFFAKRA